MYIGCVNSVVSHNFTLTRALQCLHTLWTYMDIFTTDYQRHAAEMVVVESALLKPDQTGPDRTGPEIRQK